MDLSFSFLPVEGKKRITLLLFILYSARNAKVETDDKCLHYFKPKPELFDYTRNMKEIIQEKINRFGELAKNSAKEGGAKTGRNFHASDSLSQVIRNAKEANVFLEELDVAIRISRKK